MATHAPRERKAGIVVIKKNRCWRFSDMALLRLDSEPKNFCPERDAPPSRAMPVSLGAHSTEKLCYKGLDEFFEPLASLGEKLKTLSSIRVDGLSGKPVTHSIRVPDADLVRSRGRLKVELLSCSSGPGRVLTAHFQSPRDWLGQSGARVEAQARRAASAGSLRSSPVHQTLKPLMRQSSQASSLKLSVSTSRKI